MIRYLFAAAIFILFQGCADTLTNSDVQGTDYQITVVKPADNDTIGYRGDKVQYTLQTTTAMNFVELYVNDNFIENFAPANNQNPTISISLDSSFEGKQIELYLIFYGKNSTSYKSNVIKSLFVSGDRTLPSRPYNVKIIRISNTILNISWEDNSPYIQEYQIWRKAGLNGTFEHHLTAAASARNINDENLTDGVTYYYKIKGVSKNGISDFSDIISSSGSGGSSNVPAPGKLSANVQDIKLIRLNWNDNSSNENYFKIERRREWTAFETIGYTVKNIQSYTDSANGLTGGAEYYYRVKAVSDNDSSWSNEVYIFLPSYILKAPDILSIKNPASRRVTLTWNDNDQNYADFIIERKPEGGVYTSEARVAGNIYTYSDTVEPGKTYIYRIKQDDGSYSSPYSNEQTISTQIIVPPAPENLNGYFDGNVSVLNWQFTSDAEKFVVERRDSTAGTTYVELGFADIQSKEYKDYSTVCQHIYVYRVKAVDPYLSSSYSSEKVIKNWDLCP